MALSYPTRPYGLATTEGLGVPHADAEGITEDRIRAVVVEFYRRARRDDRLGPVERHRDIDGLSARRFDRWVELFEDTVRDLCPPREAGAPRGGPWEPLRALFRGCRTARTPSVRHPRAWNSEA